MVFRAAVRNLGRNTRRTATIITIVAVGVGSLFISDGFNSGVMNQYRDNTIHARYGYGSIFTKGYHETTYAKPWEHWIGDYNALREKALSIPGVADLFPRVSISAFIQNGKGTVVGRGEGIDARAEYPFFTSLNFVHGRNLSDESDGIVVGRGVAQALSLKVGDRVSLLAQSTQGHLVREQFRLVGVFYTGLQQFDDSAFRIQLPKAQQLLQTHRIESVSLALDSFSSWNHVAREVVSSFPSLEAVPFSVLDEVYYQHSVNWLQAQFAFVRVIILAMMILGIFNTVSVSMLERRPEIGMLKANGESVADVLRLLSLEGLILGILGALAGIVFSILIVNAVIPHGIYMPAAPALTRRFWVKVELQPSMALIAFFVGSGTTLLTTALAGIRVARTPIGQALRSL